jgi:hypothetical protein
MAYYKTTIVVEVLSEEPIDPSSLADIHDGITVGEWSGDWKIQATKPLSSEQMAQELIKQGTDPEFFGLIG